MQIQLKNCLFSSLQLQFLCVVVNSIKIQLKKEKMKFWTLQPPADVSVNEALMWKPFYISPLCMHVCFWYVFVHYLFTGLLKASHQHVNQPRHRQCESQREHTVLLLQQTRGRDRQVGGQGAWPAEWGVACLDKLSLCCSSAAQHTQQHVFITWQHTLLWERADFTWAEMCGAEPEPLV